MSLVDAILNNRNSVVEELLKADSSSVNEVDDYGYTPLIEAAIANNKDIATLLLAHGAKVNDTDYVGGTALQWAVENNNLPLCKTLLEHKADPNAYTLYGQSSLVKPLLRQQHELKQLLYQFGGDLKFAQDYINTKLIGHRFELFGRVDVVDAKGKFIEIDLEGFILEFTLNVIVDSLTRFRNNFAARTLRADFDDFAWVIHAYAVAVELIKYQQYMVKVADCEAHIYSLFDNELLLIPIGYEGHAITFIKYKNFWAHCDRGAHGIETGQTVTVYQINNSRALTKEFIKNLLYKKQTKAFINYEIPKILGLTPIAVLPLKPQIIGNCSWANVEASMPTMLFMLRLARAKGAVISEITAEAMHLFQYWREWDKDRALYDCTQDFYDTTAARKASKAALLAAVLAQCCNYSIAKDLERAEKIMEIFKKYPEYQYILKAYLKAYHKSPAGVDTNLQSFLDYFGVLLS